jgi:hypothetical protein
MSLQCRTPASTSSCTQRCRRPCKVSTVAGNTLTNQAGTKSICTRNPECQLARSRQDVASTAGPDSSELRKEGVSLVANPKAHRSVRQWSRPPPSSRRPRAGRASSDGYTMHVVVNAAGRFHPWRSIVRKLRPRIWDQIVDAARESLLATAASLSEGGLRPTGQLLRSLPTGWRQPGQRRRSTVAAPLSAVVLSRPQSH